ncbi:hypothetical protein MK786_07120 [Microbacterium sp. CFH 31415]|uniref:hypothetical protein n=1 Tax=Microbacterium sp. CFH 31415 TaxID=2921732 RepID=UPI001F132A9A|nr:hypothetical protein [Microbacterium sp. CFH 31415]MCH6230507.1 hypothetical protein [Microbacterium sp. CFH 31415]
MKLLYFEEFDRVSDAYLREKQVQGWSRAKRLALAKERIEKLPGLSKKDFSGAGSRGGDVSRETARA